MTNLSHLQGIQCVKEKQDLENEVFETPSLKHNQENMKRNLPVTSTAVCNTRMVRRSARLSTRRSLHSTLIKRLSPRTCHESEESFMTDVSIMEANVTAIEANVDSPKLGTFSRGTNKTFENKMVITRHYNTASQNDQSTKPEETHRQKSTRLEAMKGTKNSIIFGGQSPLSNTGTKRCYEKGNVLCKFNGPNLFCPALIYSSNEINCDMYLFSLSVFFMHIQ